MRSVAAPLLSLRVSCRAAILTSLSSVGAPLIQRRLSSFNKFDAVDYVGRTRNVTNAFNLLELNLFDDPTGGLTAGPAEELTTTEIENQARLYVASHSRSLFYLLYTPFVDVISVVIEQGLVPETARPGEVMCRWFTDGVSTLQNPSSVELAMGLDTWQQLRGGLDALYEGIEPVMPLTAAARKHGLPLDVLVPFLRQLAMEMLVPSRRRAALEILPGLILGLANGRAPAAFGFPTDSQRERAVITADLFMGAGQETGNTDLAYLGLQLLRANDIPVPFSKQKQLTNVFSASTRIQTDWQMRISGQLVEIFPKWMEYYKKVHHDNNLSLRRLVKKDPQTLGTRGQKEKEKQMEEEDEEELEGEGENKKKTKKKSKEVLTRPLVDMKDSSEAVDKKQPAKNNKKKIPFASGDELTTDPLTTSTTAVTGAAKNPNSDVHDYFSCHQEEEEVRLSAIERTILQCVRERDEAWRNEEKQLPQRYGFGARRRNAAAAAVNKINDSDKCTENLGDDFNTDADIPSVNAEVMSEELEDTPVAKAKPKSKPGPKESSIKQKRKTSNV